MALMVRAERLVGDGSDVELANRFLAHLGSRNFSLATCRAYAYDVLNFFRFLAEQDLALVAVRPTDSVRLSGLAGGGGTDGWVDGGAVVAVPGCGAGDDEPADRRGAGAVRVRRDDRRGGGQPGAGTPAAVSTCRGRPCPLRTTSRRPCSSTSPVCAST